MKVYIKSFKLLNFQSWDNNSPEIPIESDIVNIIEGANETGKSVLYKVLYNMCFPGYWDANELIRRGFETACLFIMMTDGSIIVYELNHREHTYYLQENDQTLQWNNCEIPDKIVDKLGLILDRESKVILNVIDKDVPLPFIKSTPKFNASLIRAVVEPPKITDFFSRLADHLKEVDCAKGVFKSKTEAAAAAAAVLDYQDIDALAIAKEKTDVVLEVTKAVTDLELCLNEYSGLKQSEPIKVLEPIRAKQLLSFYDFICECTQSLAEFRDTKLSKPAVSVSPEAVQPSIIVFDALQNILNSVSGCIDTLGLKPEEVAKPAVGNLIDVFDKLEEVQTGVNTCTNVLHEINERQALLKTLDSEIQDIRDKVGVCPTCGRLL